MNKYQQRIIDRIKENEGYNITQIDENEYFVAVQFRNTEEHPLLKEDFMLFIGKRGRVDWISAYRLGASLGHSQTMTHIAHVNIFGYGKKFNFKK